VEFEREMGDDLPNSEVADQIHEDLLVKRLTDSDSTGFSNDLEKEASGDEVPKTSSRRVFLQARYAHELMIQSWWTDNCLIH
jgi:hypothetical protein